MKLVSGFSILFLSALAIAQQGNNSAARMPEAVFAGQAESAQEASPLQSPQSSQVLTSPEIQQQIVEQFNGEPVLSESALSVKVDDNSVLLTGMVHNEQEHKLALRIVWSYAGTREVVDRTTGSAY